MKRQKSIYLTFSEYFAIIIVISGVLAYFTAGSLNHEVLDYFAPFFYIIIVLLLLAIFIFKPEFNRAIFIAVLFLFSLFYVLLSYSQRSRDTQNFVNFTARLNSDVEYRNGKSIFEGVLTERGKFENRLKYAGKALISTNIIYPGLVKGAIIKGRGEASLIKREKSGYDLYLFSKGIDYTIKASDFKIVGASKLIPFNNFVFKIKRYIEMVCDRILPYPHSTFASALLSGNRKQIPSYMNNLFKRVGTLHILAISGLHLGFIIGIFIVVLKFMGLRHRLLYGTASILVILYALFIGNSPSILRASMMFVIGILLYIFDRDRDYINLIAVVFLMLMLFNPRSLYNPGFLLSFSATFGIVYLGPFIKKALDKYLPATLSILISMSIAASVYNFPVMIGYFGEFSYISVIANIAVIPMTALILILSILMVAVYPIFLPFAVLIAKLNSFFISLLFFINIILSHVPPITLDLNAAGNTWIVIYFGAVTALIYYFAKRREKTVELSLFNAGS